MVKSDVYTRFCTELTFDLILELGGIFQTWHRTISFLKHTKVHYEHGCQNVLEIANIICFQALDGLLALIIYSKFEVGLKSLLGQGLSEPEFYEDFVYKLKKIVGSYNFSAQSKNVRHTQIWQLAFAHFLIPLEDQHIVDPKQNYHTPGLDRDAPVLCKLPHFRLW